MWVYVCVCEKEQCREREYPANSEIFRELKCQSMEYECVCVRERGGERGREYGPNFEISLKF